ncbi:MAG TPA: hypothetical protein VMC86_11180 [Gemmatimonadales bacterium]|nr:hypothetical protein [Gemmatimonadales bacterium]
MRACLRVVMLSLAAGVGVAGLPAGAQAQRNDGTSMIDILGKTFGADTIIENQNKEIVRMEMDIVSDSKESFRMLTDRWTYGIVALGDSRIAQIHLSIYRELDGNWSLVTESTNDGTLALVTVTPQSTARYRFVVSVPRFNESYTAGHYSLIIYHN